MLIVGNRQIIIAIGQFNLLRGSKTLATTKKKIPLSYHTNRVTQSAAMPRKRTISWDANIPVVKQQRHHIPPPPLPTPTHTTHLTVGFLVPRTCAWTAKLLGLAPPVVGNEECSVILYECLLQLVLGVLVDVFLVVCDN